MMTNKEYAKEWPFALTDAEIELMRTPPHEQDRYEREDAKHLMKWRIAIDGWLGRFDKPLLKHRLRRILWALFGRWLLEQVRPRLSE